MRAERTIDELAREAGLVVSTVRLYQNRGLLLPPVRRGRVGYYGEEHLRRLRLIAELQERGFSLAAIKELVDGLRRGMSLAAVLGLGAAGAPTWATEEPQTVRLADVAARLPGVSFDAALVRRTVELGVLELADDGIHAVIRHPSFLEIGSRLLAVGVPVDVILDEYERLRAETRAIAQRFTGVFREHLWEPAVGGGGARADQTGRLVGALEELGPLAEAIVLASLRLALQDAAEEFADAEAERLGVEVPRPGEPG